MSQFIIVLLYLSKWKNDSKIFRLPAEALRIDLLLSKWKSVGITNFMTVQKIVGERSFHWTSRKALWIVIIEWHNACICRDLQFSSESQNTTLVVNAWYTFLWNKKIWIIMVNFCSFSRSNKFLTCQNVKNVRFSY